MSMLVVGDVPEGHLFVVHNEYIGWLGNKGNTQFIKLSKHSHTYSGKNVLNCSTWLPAYIKDDVEVIHVMKLGQLITNVLQTIVVINWQQLREQKQWLVNQSHTFEAGGNDDGIESNNAEGLVNFLDALMDAVVADKITDETSVFGPNEDAD